MQKIIPVVFFSIFLGMGAAGGWLAWRVGNQPPAVSYNAFLEQVNNTEVKEVHFHGNEIRYQDIFGRGFTTFAPDIPRLLPLLTEHQVAIFGREAGMFPPWLIALVALPITIALLLSWLVASRKKHSREETSDFAQSAKTPAIQEGGCQVTFRDVAGLPEVKEEVLEIVDFLQQPEKYDRLGAIIPKGILLQGPPGTGKTLLARAIAGEAGVPFYSISGSDFVEMFVGVGASRVRELFREVKKHAPAILFIDEIDAVGMHRSSGGGAGGQEERSQTLNALLVEMDGFKKSETVVVLAATNRPDILDQALRRPGRFDRQITLLPPDIRGRKEILALHLQKTKVADNLNIDAIAEATPGFTGAELANLVNEAAIIAARHRKKAVDKNDFEAAKDRVLMGIERKGLIINEMDRKVMAYHEAGHAVLAKLLPEADPLRKITIIPRGLAMGHTQQLAGQDRHVYTKKYLSNRIIILLGGRVAEELALDLQTTGAANDFKEARRIAQNMVRCWGMNDVIGPLNYCTDDACTMGLQYEDCGPETTNAINQEVKKLVEECYREARTLLGLEQYFLTVVAEVLLQKETLVAEEVEALWQRYRAAAHSSGPEAAVASSFSGAETEEALATCRRALPSVAHEATEPLPVRQS